MKILRLIVLCLLFCGAAIGQCDLTLKDAPAIRGLKFGMSGDQVIATIGKPLKTLDPDANNWAYNPGMQLTDVKGLDGITLLSLSFYNGKLFNITVDYNPQITWKDAREFSQAISPSLKLPTNGWKFDDMNSRRAEMVCKEFNIVIDTSAFGILIATDLVAEQKRRDDEKTRAGEWKKVFKP